MPAQPQIPAWARELGATPEGLAAFRNRRRRGGMIGAPGGVRPAPAPLPGPLPPMPGGGGPVPGGGGGMPVGGGAGSVTAPSRPPSDAMIQSGIDSGAMSVKDAVAALDARKAGVAMPPPVKPPMPTKPDGTVTPPTWDPTGGKGTGAPTLPPNPDDGTVTPPIWVDPTGQKPTGGGVEAPAPELPPVMTPPPAPPPERMAAFDFSPFEGQANYHQDPRFQQGWDQVFSALGGMDPETRARAEEAMAGMGQIEAGGARGMNAWIQAINRARGFEDQDPAATEAGTLPPGTNPPPPGAGGTTPLPGSGEQPVDLSGAEATYDEIIGQGGNPIFNPRFSGGSLGKGGFHHQGPRQGRQDMAALEAAGLGGRRNPMLAPPPEAMAEALGEAGMRRGGRRPRPGTNPRPTLPNERGQGRPRRRGGPVAVIPDESRQVPPRRRPQGPRNPRAGGY